MTQDCRQVLIELMFLSLYLDDRLSMAEDEELNKAIESLGWDSPMSREQFLLAAFPAAKQAAADPIATEAYLDSRVGVIQRAGEEAAAMTWLSRVIGSDGISGLEKRFIDRIQSRLYPDG